MCCSVTCPACRKGVVPEVILDKKREVGQLDDGKPEEESLLAGCTECSEVFHARAIVTARGEVYSFTEVSGSPLLRTPCPRCRNVVGAKAAPCLLLPPTGGDYEWIETDAEVICPICDYLWSDRIKADLDPRAFSVIPHQVVGPRWEKAYVAAKTSYVRGEIYGTEEVRAFATRQELIEWSGRHPKLFERMLRPGAYEYVLFERQGRNYFSLDGAQFC